MCAALIQMLLCLAEIVNPGWLQDFLENTLNAFDSRRRSIIIYSTVLLSVRFQDSSDVNVHFAARSIKTCV